MAPAKLGGTASGDTRRLFAYRTTAWALATSPASSAAIRGRDHAHATRLRNLGALAAAAVSRDQPPRSAALPEAPIYPLTGAITNAVNIFDANLETPYAQSWTVGFQRALRRQQSKCAMSARGPAGLTNFNLNEVNIVENRFLDEFKAAPANLRANMGAGRGNSLPTPGPARARRRCRPTWLPDGCPAPRRDAGTYTASRSTNTHLRRSVWRPQSQPASPDRGDANSRFAP